MTKFRIALMAVVGALLLTAVGSTTAHAALEPFHSDSGFISLSVDAAGTNNTAGVPIDVRKASGATVKKAFLFAASTGFSGYTPVDGDVTIDGSPVAWDSAKTVSSAIASVNVVSDVTALVKPKVDAAPAGDVTFNVAEPNNPGQIDGVVLAVILNDPTVTKSGSVILLYGAQQTTGDTFHVALAEPVDKSQADFALNLSLGISFGFQPGVQYSTVDVNSTRMTSSAGGQDDGENSNGALITAGGLGDTNDNPADPNAAGCDSSPRCDDELYDLLPFVNNGDTSLTFNTTNPSNDDNIFFGALDVRAGGAIVGKGVVLSPVSAVNPVGTPHSLTATVQDDSGNPISGVTVHFEVTSGPNDGTNGDAVTDADGKAQFTYTSTNSGTDTIVASFVDSQGNHVSNEVTKTWEGKTNESPDCSAVTSSPKTLWPPNHKYRLITLSGATDPDDDPVSLTVTTVTQDEALDGAGDGSTKPDATRGPAAHQVYVRSERSGSGDGRVYRISFTGSDGRGGECTGTTKVTVPHDQGKKGGAVDSGLTVNSFGS